MPNERQGATSDLVRYGGMGLQFAVTVGVFALAGQWLDQRLGTSPGCLLAGVFLGFGLGLYSMVKKLPARPRDDSKPPR